jgi:hypothetical protein
MTEQEQIAAQQAAEAAAQKAAIEALIEQAIAEAFADLVKDEAFQKAVGELGNAMYQTIAAGDPAGLTGEVSQIATAKARRLAEDAARSLAEQIAKADLNSMGETIARGLEAGKRPRDLYNQLQEVKGLDSNRAKTYENLKNKLEESDLSDAELQKRLDREYQKLLQERRKTIAQTEGRNATSEARRVEAENRGAKWKRWVTSQDDRVSEVCLGNEADGVIPIEQAFSSGHQQTPGHPNCRCSVSYVKSDKAKESAELRQQQRIDESKARKEAENNG